MAQIQNVLKVELDPNRPVPEITQVIQAIISLYPPIERESILEGIKDEVSIGIKQLKGVDPHGEPVRKPNSK
ncbi:hypothetical protein [Paenibacillus woosongensis]|uniref:Uncharacterized protein n=1 Tax=Paenibacillus woosongensis TaxID=307580 RepID=A0ABQ4MPJ0_9BACL|nr:hypothetical protein [Paenibacillus woosongensis]GIP57921.1 hypothetical protein J15TS10_17350 [Paenibacillus woosongensis]